MVLLNKIIGGGLIGGLINKAIEKVVDSTSNSSSLSSKGFPTPLITGPFTGRNELPFEREIKNKVRKKTEEVADKVHPNVGKVVKAAHNLNNTCENALDSYINGFRRAVLSPEVKEISEADHLFVQGIGYTHHGLYLGNGRVMHYADDGFGSSIHEVDLEVFADGRKVHKKISSESPISYSTDEVISRAYQRMYEDKYNLIFNNCEHFVRWCRNGTENL